MMKLDVKSFALAGGIIWGVTMFVLTWTSMTFEYGEGLMYWLVGAYPGYTVTTLGSVVGMIWGFVDAFVGLYIFAWLYNKLSSRK